MELGNSWSLNDYLNAREAWIAGSNKNHRQVYVYKFAEYDTEGNAANPNERFRRPVFTKRLDAVWLSMVRVFDTVKGGYFTTGDLNVNSEFVLQGYSPSYTTPSGVLIPEYAGDMIEWNGKLWEVADQLEPVQWGFLADQVLYSTVMRRTQRSGIGIKVGP